LLCRNYKGNHHGLVITGQPYFKVLPDNSERELGNPIVNKQGLLNF
jgi:hypothetical protein